MRYLALILLVLSLCGCGVMREISAQSFRNATTTGAKTELRRLGYRVRDLHCRLPRGNTLSVVRVNCSGRTVHGQAVVVTGVARDAETAHPDQDFVITVGGREVLHKPCLGVGCDKTTAR